MTMRAVASILIASCSWPVIACSSDDEMPVFAPRGVDSGPRQQQDGGQSSGPRTTISTATLEEMLDFIDQIGADADDPDRVCTGWQHGCAIDVNGRARCWGEDGQGQASPPDDLPTVRQITCGFNFSCALTDEFELRCWGAGSDPSVDNDINHGQASPPAGLFRQVSAGVGGMHACAINANDLVECWGAGSRARPADAPLKYGQATPPTDRFFSHVSAGQAHSCGVDFDTGQVVCWGGAGDGTCFPPRSYSCGQTSAPLGSFERVTAGGFHTCALSEEGKVTCWGRGMNANDCAPDNEAAQFDCGQSEVPELEDDLTYLRVSAGSLHTCAILSDYHARCWGWDNYAMQASPPPQATFTQVAAGDLHSCAFRTDGTIGCWGTPAQGRGTPPSDFASE
jgi:alpha-tubulin suppressor-like RCC1 family protein